MTRILQFLQQDFQYLLCQDVGVGLDEHCSNFMVQSLLEHLKVAQMLKKFPAFMGLTCPLPCSQKPAIGPILSQLNPGLTLISYFCKTHFSIAGTGVIQNKNKSDISSVKFVYVYVCRGPG
jgi:hypothetical protein